MKRIDFSRYYQPVLIGQLNIHEDQMREKTFDLFHRFDAIRCLIQEDTRESGGKKARQTSAKTVVILNQHHFESATLFSQEKSSSPQRSNWPFSFAHIAHFTGAVQCGK